ncbi:MAG TPA: hypothetical protein VLC73_08450 [Burkholderiales bacterium]|nr:hypothetical protein [Burkholderiales bacterium]
MTDQLKTTDVNAIHAKPFAKMTPGEKAKHMGKVFLFLLTFGFAFPHILSD